MSRRRYSNSDPTANTSVGNVSKQPPRRLPLCAVCGHGVDIIVKDGKPTRVCQFCMKKAKDER